MAEPVTIVLKAPITIGKENPTVVTEITFRPMKAKDLRGYTLSGLDEMNAVLGLAGRLSGQPNHVVDELSGEDLAEVISLVTGFIKGSLLIGSERSP